MLRGKPTGQFLPILRDSKIPIGSPAFNNSPGTQWPTYSWAPDSVFVNHRAQERRTYGAVQNRGISWEIEA
jgi:hypothetical protein